LKKLIKNLKKKTEDVTETGGDDERK